MSSREHESLLQEFKSSSVKGGAIYLGVCGGRASEGVDYPGRQLDVVFVAGVPFEEPSALNEARLSHYIEKYGEERGHMLAYVAPAVRKAVQAAGRAFRSPSEAGVVVLGDRRFKRLKKLLPSWLARFETIDWNGRASMLIKVAKTLDVELPWKVGS